jgi:PAS domain S-box-containing protein
MDVDGRVVQIVAISKDVTERVEAQVQLTRQKELLGKILDHLPESVFVRDGDGVWQMCNRSFAERHGFDSPGEFIGDADFGRGGLYFSEEDRISDNAVIEGEARLVRRAERQRPDGSLIVEEITKFPLHDEYGRVVAVLGISEDITGRLRAEAEHLQEQKRRLQEHITRSIGHCLKNRVTTLETCRYALEQQFGHTKALDLMKDAIASFKHALRVALSFERLEAGMQREWVSINVALMKLTEQLQDPRLRLLDLAEAAIVLGDGFHIENALLELLHNALAFAPRSELGGVVRVWTEVRDDVCFIHVADNGPGIREDLREHLFDRFSRGDPSRTGMGLAYVREVFQQPRAAWSPYTPGRPERTSLLGFRFTMLRIRS